jgi:hypothetical protein
MTATSEIPIDIETYDSTSAGKNYKVGVLAFDEDIFPDRVAPYVVTVRGRNPSASLNDGSTRDISFIVYTRNYDLSEMYVGVSESSSNGSAFFPNPFNNRITLKLPYDQVYPVKIFSVDQRVLFEGTLKNGDEIDLSHLTPSTLVYQIGLHDRVITGKMVKAR